MPSKTEKQLNLFKIVKAYVDGGRTGLMGMWKDLYPNRDLSDYEFEKIIRISKGIDYADLEDMASGIEGDEVLGDKKDIKVGYWMKFEAWFSNYKGEKRKGTFIAKITKVSPSIKIANFNSEDIYNKNGSKIAPLKRTRISDADRMWLDFAFFNQILETAKNKEELVMKNEIRKIVRDVLFESYLNENEEGAVALQIKKKDSDEEVDVRKGLEVEKVVKSDDSIGVVKSVKVTQKNNIPTNLIEVEWTSGDLSGTTQDLDPEDLQAL
jgi:hypothetical protein